MKAGIAAGALALSGLSIDRTPDTALGQEANITLAETYSEGDRVGAASLDVSGPRGFQTTFPFTAVGVHWSGDVAFPVTVALSFSADNVTYSDPIAVTASNDLGRPTRDGRIFADLVFTEPSTWVRYETADGSGNPAQIAGLSFTSLDSSTGPNPFDATGGEVTTAATVGKPRVISRAEWGADERLRYDAAGEIWPPEYRDVEHVIIHHTDTPNFQDPFAAIRSIYYYHTVTQGWGDIGYNYLVDFRGNIYEGRVGGENTIGGHAYQYAEGSSGIGVMGDFAFQDTTAATQSAIVAITAYTGRFLNPLGSADFFQVPDLPTIAAHRDVNQSTCPGDYLYDDLPLIRRYVNEVINGGATSPSYGVGSVVTVSVAGANLRAAASPTAQVRAVMNVGTSLTITGASTANGGYTWHPVTGSYGAGFVANTVIQPTAPGNGGFAIGASATINAGGVNLRVAAGTDSNVVTTLASGTAVTITGGPTQSDGQTWWAVRTAANGDGWVTQNYLTLGGAGAGPARVIYGTSLTSMPIRSRPGNQWATISTVGTGVQVQVTDGPLQVEGQTWYGVYRQGFGGGWSLASQLRIPGVTTPPTTNPIPATFQVGATVTTTASIYLRRTASETGAIAATIPQGRSLTITGPATTSGGYAWYPITSPVYGTGFVASAFLSAGGVPPTGQPTPTPTPSPTPEPTPNPTPSPTPTPGQFAVGSTVAITGGDVNVRSGPSTSAAIRGVASTGQTFTVTGAPTTANGYTWYPVRSARFGDGYIAGAFLVAGSGSNPSPNPTPSPTPSPTPTPTPIPGQFAVGSTVAITGGQVNVRSGPSTSAAIRAVASTGQTFTVTGAPTTANGYTWYPVRNASLGDGYVAGAFLVASGGSNPTPTPTPLPSSDQFAVGGTVVTTLGSVNYRSGPSTTAGIRNVIAAGQRFTVTGAPTAANGYTWYPLRSATYGDGYIASAYLRQG